MNRRLMTRIAGVAAVTTLGVGLMAQSGRPQRGQFDPEARAAFLAGYLELTDSQKTQAKEIFASARTEAEQARGQMKSAREALEAAVKTNASDSRIDQASAAVGALATQQVASMAKRFAKFYAILTPQQKEKLETLKAQWEDRIGGMLGRRL
ncbi:MAG: Spy/CpxP family protein refolding chaperone [Bryobacterales bacterium]|nr:Spy/CpxP family protein refolding chaperone [Bryobacterales bacterium]